MPGYFSLASSFSLSGGWLDLSFLSLEHEDWKAEMLRKVSFSMIRRWNTVCETASVIAQFLTFFL